MLIVHVLLVTEKYLGSGLILNDPAEFFGEKKIRNCTAVIRELYKKALDKFESFGGTALQGL